MNRLNMRKGFFLAMIIATFAPMLSQARAFESSEVKAAQALAKRVIPIDADHFRFHPIDKEKERDVFEIETRNGLVHISGSSGVAMAAGLNWYLKHHCNVFISLWGNAPALPKPLPQLPSKVRQPSPFQYRYYINYCAFSYTFAFWHWEQWERLIDFMALQGVNMPLAVTGQEAVWQKVYRKMGLTDEEIKAFIVGPGFLPFGWMGCIDGWGGPIPDNWIDSHRDLQKKILKRERELGMTPVLQGFTGHVPAAIKRVRPEAKLQQLTSWCGFAPTHFLDPSDPLFRDIGKAYIREQSRMFGTDHYYGADTFIEMTPSSNDPAFLKKMGSALYEAQAAGDPKAVWIMQGWPFLNTNFWTPQATAALLSSVPDDRMILIDLWGEFAPVWKITNSFYGKPWIWSIIHSFGDETSMHAALPQIVDGLTSATTSSNAGKLDGIGFIMEGLGANPIVYDLMTDMTWEKNKPNIKDWITDYTTRRYGVANQKVQQAQQLLLETAYTINLQRGSMVCGRPSLNGHASFINHYDKDRKKLAEAWGLMVEASKELNASDSFRYDLVNLSREAMIPVAQTFLGETLVAYQKKDRAATQKASQRFMELAHDLDELVTTRRELLLGPWLENAKRWAKNDEERRLYEWNARTLLTLWGPSDSMLHDYSNRQWSGLIQDFYIPRWQLFYMRMDEAMAAGKEMDAAAFEKEVQKLEEDWTRKTNNFAVEATGDPIKLSLKMWDKYGVALK